MRQDQRGAPDHQPIQRLLDHRLVLCVDRGQRLVQHQDRRVAQQRPGDGDALALAAREARAAFADHGLIAIGQRFDEVMRVGGAGGGDKLGLVGVGAAETQVVLDRAVEQVGVLRHDGDHPAHRLRVERAQVLPADADRAALRVVQAEQQAHDGGLAGAAGPDDADALAGGDAEGQALVRGAPAAGIGEAARRRRRCSGCECRSTCARVGAAALGAVTGSSSSALMPAAAAWPVRPWCSTVRRSRSGRKISVPAISTISSASRLISPWRTR